MATLFEIEADFRAMDDLLEECGGDISDPQVSAAIEAWEKELDAAFETKVDSYCAFVKELSARADARKQEADRLLKRVRVDENAAKQLKERLCYVFEQRGIKTSETKRFRVSVAKNGGKLPLLFTAAVPPGWLMHPPPVPDKEKIRVELERGHELSFAELGERGTHINIR